MATSYKAKYNEIVNQMTRMTGVFLSSLEERERLQNTIVAQDGTIAALESQVERLQSAAARQIEKVLSNEANSKPQKEAKSKGLAQQ